MTKENRTNSNQEKPEIASLIERMSKQTLSREALLDNQIFPFEDEGWLSKQELRDVHKVIDLLSQIAKARRGLKYEPVQINEGVVDVHISYGGESGNIGILDLRKVKNEEQLVWGLGINLHHQTISDLDAIFTYQRFIDKKFLKDADKTGVGGKIKSDKIFPKESRKIDGGYIIDSRFYEPGVPILHRSGGCQVDDSQVEIFFKLNLHEYSDVDGIELIPKENLNIYFALLDNGSGNGVLFVNLYDAEPDFATEKERREYISRFNKYSESLIKGKENFSDSFDTRYTPYMARTSEKGLALVLNVTNQNMDDLLAEDAEKSKDERSRIEEHFTHFLAALYAESDEEVVTTGRVKPNNGNTVRRTKQVDNRRTMKPLSGDGGQTRGQKITEEILHIRNKNWVGLFSGASSVFVFDWIRTFVENRALKISSERYAERYDEMIKLWFNQELISPKLLLNAKLYLDQAYDKYIKAALPGFSREDLTNKMFLSIVQTLLFSRFLYHKFNTESLIQKRIKERISIRNVNFPPDAMSYTKSFVKQEEQGKSGKPIEAKKKSISRLKNNEKVILGLLGLSGCIIEGVGVLSLAPVLLKAIALLEQGRSLREVGFGWMVAGMIGLVTMSRIVIQDKDVQKLFAKVSEIAEKSKKRERKERNSGSDLTGI